MKPDLSVYLVTDSVLAAASGRDLVDIVTQAVEGGVTAVQVREKDASARVFLETVLRISHAIDDSVALFVNDRVDVFLAARAVGARVTGVHVGQSDLPVSAVRAMIGSEPVIGLSAATDEELRLAASDLARVDYVGIGVVRETRTKLDAPVALGLGGFERQVRRTELPAVAIGGITAADLPSLHAAGAAGAAVVSVIFTAPDPRSAARELAAAWAGDA